MAGEARPRPEAAAPRPGSHSPEVGMRASMGGRCTTLKLWPPEIRRRRDLEPRRRTSLNIMRRAVATVGGDGDDV
jgi:hypothetical protein